MADCIFCMLANHDIPTNVVYEDDEMFCFHDAEPQAPVHVLLIPKKHIECIDDLKEEDLELVGRMMLKIKDIAKEMHFPNQSFLGKYFKENVGMSPSKYRKS